MVNRTTVSGSSTPPLTPSAFFNEYAERIDTLFDASALPLTAVGGTANAVTATLDPPLASAGVFVDGMKFTLTWAAANTAGVTLAINGGAPLPVLDAAGTALVADAVGAGLRSLLEYIGGSFRILSPLLSGGGGGGSARYFWQFTASGTWTKPAGLDDDTMVTIEGWGSGAGGSSANNGPGGAGGSYVMRRMRVGDLPSSVAVAIGAGGAINATGGDTTFGAVLTAYAGRNGGNSSGNGGGGGGGEIGRGNTTSAAAGGAGGPANGGRGGSGATDGPAQPGDNSFWGGGGGGGGATGTSGTRSGGNGGSSVFGGGGGAGMGTSSNGTGGLSLYGGSGGNVGVAGTAPGGGGGRNAPGARGEVRVWI